MSLTNGFYGDNVDVTETEKTLRKALDLGVTLLNTADFYTSMTSGATYENIKLIGVCLLAFSAPTLSPAADSCILYFVCWPWTVQQVPRHSNGIARAQQTCAVVNCKFPDHFSPCNRQGLERLSP